MGAIEIKVAELYLTTPDAIKQMIVLTMQKEEGQASWQEKGGSLMEISPAWQS
jgi:hypothetical protein